MPIWAQVGLGLSGLRLYVRCAPVRWGRGLPMWAQVGGERLDRGSGTESDGGRACRKGCKSAPKRHPPH